MLMDSSVINIISSLHDRRPVRVLFVCLGNICRSPAAHGVFQNIVDENHDSDAFFIDSAGTQGYHAGDLPDPRMRAHARRRGYDLTHVCRRVTLSDFSDFDLIIGMDDSNVHNLRQMALTPEQEAKVVPMAAFLTGVYARHDSVPDPYYSGAEGFELVLDLLQDGCRNLYDLLRKDASR